MQNWALRNKLSLTHLIRNIGPPLNPNPRNGPANRNVTCDKERHAGLPAESISGTWREEDKMRAVAVCSGTGPFEVESSSTDNRDIIFLTIPPHNIQVGEKGYQKGGASYFIWERNPPPPGLKKFNYSPFPRMGEYNLGNKHHSSPSQLGPPPKPWMGNKMEDKNTEVQPRLLKVEQSPDMPPPPKLSFRIKI